MLLRLGFYILKKGGLNIMAIANIYESFATIYASFIISGDILYKNVPAVIKPEVKTVLTSFGFEELAVA